MMSMVVQTETPCAPPSCISVNAFEFEQHLHVGVLELSVYRDGDSGIPA
jgi:hypothetical protein